MKEYKTIIQVHSTGSASCCVKIIIIRPFSKLRAYWRDRCQGTLGVGTQGPGTCIALQGPGTCNQLQGLASSIQGCICLNQLASSKRLKGAARGCFPLQTLEVNSRYSSRYSFCIYSFSTFFSELAVQRYAVPLGLRLERVAVASHDLWGGV